MSRKIISSNEESIKSLPTIKKEISELEAEIVKDKRLLAERTFQKNAMEMKRAATSGEEIELALLNIRVKYPVKPISIKAPTEKDIADAKLFIEEEPQARKELVDATRHNDQLMSLMAERPTVRDYESEIESIDRRIKKLVDETLPCPAGDACPYTKMIGPELALLRKDRETKVSADEQSVLSLREWEKKMEAAGPRIDTTTTQDKLNAADWGRKQIQLVEDIRERKEIEAKILVLEKSIGDTPTAEEVMRESSIVDGLTETLSRVEIQLGDLRARETSLITLLSEAKRMTAEIKEMESKIKIVQDEADLLTELKDALGTTGITAVALDYLLPSLEDKINEILSMLSDFKVELSTQKAGATGSTLEGLFISVVNPQREKMDFNSYSGGERVRISVAISEALASLQHVGFRIMDETVQALDEDMVDNFTKVLSTIQSRYSQTICISHLQSVKDLFDKKLTVIKLDGISRVV